MRRRPCWRESGLVLTAAVACLGYCVSPASAQRTRSGVSSAVQPVGGGFALYCQTFTGPNHAADAQQARVAMTQATGVPQWHVAHHPDRSELLFGRYASADDPAARADRDRLAALVGPDGVPRFVRPLVVMLESADPPAPPEWDLRRAKGHWTLQIAAYTGGPERKQAAVESVAEARRQGVEAYFYHGPNVSSVCVGAFPESAVSGFVNESADGATPGTGRGRPAADEAASGDPEQPIFVSNVPLSEQTAQELAGATRSGKRAKVVAPQLRYSAEIQTLRRQYPQHFVNGEAEGVKKTDPTTRQPVIAPKESMVVPIPSQPASILTGPAAIPADPSRPADPSATPPPRADEAAQVGRQPDPPARLLDPNAGTRQGGRLRSLGDR